MIKKQQPNTVSHFTDSYGNYKFFYWDQWDSNLKKIETMAPTRRVTQTTNITPREKKIQTQTVFKQTENKIMQQNWFKHN